MIKADIPQDVTEYKEQFFFGLTIRQFVCGIAMIALAILTFLIGKNFISTDILMYIVIIEVAPLAAVGFMRYNGMPFLLLKRRGEQRSLLIMHRHGLTKSIVL